MDVSFLSYIIMSCFSELNASWTVVHIFVISQSLYQANMSEAKDQKMQTKQNHNCVQDGVSDGHCVMLQKQTGEVFNIDRRTSRGKYNTARCWTEGMGEDATLLCFNSVCEVWSVLSKFLATTDPSAENSSLEKKKQERGGWMGVCESLKITWAESVSRLRGREVVKL